jgi:hypothetical protein
LAYRVPAGWSNEEDINGRYLLLPPGATRLAATVPKAVSVGSLSGSVVDVRLAAGWRKSCPNGDPPSGLVPTISGGFRPELVNHAVVKGVVVRFYPLPSPSGTVAIELQDATGGRPLDQLDAVAKTFAFS